VTGRRTGFLTPSDVALLSAVARTGSVAAASRRESISRYRGLYRLARLSEEFGGRLVTGDRGGASHGGARLTELGWRLLRHGSEVLPAAAASSSRPSWGVTALRGAWHAEPFPHVDLAGGPTLAVTFQAEEGRSVTVAVEPEAVVLARGNFPTSARNALPGVVRRIRHRVGASSLDVALVEVSVGRRTVGALVTDRAVRALNLVPGRRVVAYVKATAIRRVGELTRGSRRSSARRRPPPRGGSASR
jgi:molybdate transport system regulatory protein